MLQKYILFVYFVFCEFANKKTQKKNKKKGDRENHVKKIETLKKQEVLASMDRKLSPRQRLSAKDLYSKGIVMQGAFEV